MGAVYADTTKLRQVLFNLLSNANKFTENGRSPDGTTGPCPTGDQVLAYRPGHRHRHDRGADRQAFQPFTQADASTTRKFGGTGLGLTISKRFAEMMGGTITVSSVPDKGTTFTVVLPARVAAVETVARTASASAAGDAPTML